VVGRRFDLIFCAAVFAGLSVIATGCAFDAQSLVRFSGTSPTVVVTESVKPQQIPYWVAGVTRRNGQVVRISCATTLLYDVKEATGTAVLVQQYVAKLRTRPLRRGTPYRLDCMGPLVVQLPAAASAVGATAASASGPHAALPTRAAVTSLRIAHGKRLRPELRTQLAVIQWPSDFTAGDYELELSFTMPDARPFREKAVYTASVSCGRSRYLQPILPPVSEMARAPALTIRPSADTLTVPLPRVAAGIRTYAETTRTLSCVR
jgi:hypothetical protein